MRKVISLIVIVFIFVFSLYCESTNQVPLENAISLNFDSSAVFTYLSLERKFYTTNKVVLSGQIGIGSIPFIGGYSFPHKIIITLPAQKHVSLEIGVGGNYWMKDFTFSSDSYYIYPLFGFRIDSDYHMLFRITFSPYVNIYGDNFFAGYSFPPSVGASVGYVF